MTLEERRTQTAAFYATLPALAQSLTTGDTLPWSVVVTKPTHGEDDDYRYAHTVLRRADGLTLGFSVAGCAHPEHVHVFGQYGPMPDGSTWYPRDDRHDAHITAPTSANIALTKTPAQIAKDIIRRVLPGYAAVYQLYCARRDDQAKYVATIADHAQRLKSASDGHLILHTAERGYRNTSPTSQQGHWRDGNCQVNIYSTSVGITLSVTPEHACELLALMSTWDSP